MLAKRINFASMACAACVSPSSLKVSLTAGSWFWGGSYGMARNRSTTALSDRPSRGNLLAIRMIVALTVAVRSD